MATAAVSSAPNSGLEEFLKPKSERCETCRFWDPSTEDFHKGEIGDCRARPPAIDPIILARTLTPPSYGLDTGPASGMTEQTESAVYAASAFPMTHADSWCGDFQWSRALEPVTC